jgi:hypothetical protein
MPDEIIHFPERGPGRLSRGPQRERKIGIRGG